MTTLAIHRPLESNAIALPLPGPRHGAIAIRLAELKDVPFIDELQRKHARMVGWFPTKQIEGNIAKGNVLIAEEHPGTVHHGTHGTHGTKQESISSPSSASSASSVVNKPVGYVIACDKYLKREELGIVYQLNVAPGRQRGLIGATLIKAVFDRAAYGCKLFCCWCAQDLEANRFWESIGFVPLAFRTGSRPRLKKDGTVSKRERIHIFWQRRIREGDTETPYWFPSETTGGAVRENRLVLPIPPGTHWSDAKPAVLPGMDEALKANALPRGEAEAAPGAELEKKSRGKKEKVAAVERPIARGVWFAPASPGPAKGSPEANAIEKEKKPRRPRMKFKNDPKLVAAARELRDRYTEQINAAPGMLPPSACGKYDVSRQIASGLAIAKLGQTPLLEAA